MKDYRINEIFYSVQGEGVLAGTPMVFVRFSRCNLACSMKPGPRSPGGFDCDTEFESGRRTTLEEIDEAVEAAKGASTVAWLLLTGGEPGLQLDMAFCDHFHERGWLIAVETNGSMLMPIAAEDIPHLDDDVDLDRKLLWFGVDWICVSPKVAEHALVQRWAHEVKYVRGVGQAIPQTRVNARHLLVSPASAGENLDAAAVRHCLDLVKAHPSWRLSAQLHKLWGAR